MQINTLGTNPINKQAFWDYACGIIPNVNSYIQLMYGIENYYSEESIEEYETYLSSATVAQRVDPEILIIVYEELQPYLYGDKSESEVISIMESRINNLLSERGY